MRRLLQMVEHERVDFTPLITHHFSLEQLPDAYELFSRQADGVMKVAIHPTAVAKRATPSRDAIAIGAGAR